MEQTPAESTAYRFAKLDMKYYPLQAPPVIRGNKMTGEIYYTNSTYLNVGAPISAIERVKAEGLFHPLIEAGSLTHVWLGEHKPPAEIHRRLRQEDLREHAELPDIVQPGVHRMPELRQDHPRTEVDLPLLRLAGRRGITRVTGFFSKTTSWNKGKLGELHDRRRNQILIHIINAFGTGLPLPGPPFFIFNPKNSFRIL